MGLRPYRVVSNVRRGPCGTLVLEGAVSPFPLRLSHGAMLACGEAQRTTVAWERDAKGAAVWPPLGVEPSCGDYGHVPVRSCVLSQAPAPTASGLSPDVARP
mgnify:CR=1 FL=1